MVNTDEDSAVVYFAKWVLSEDNLIEDGAVRVLNGIIDRVGPKLGIKQANDRIVNLGDTLILPGFINLYTRFEESSLRGLYNHSLDSHSQCLDKIKTNLILERKREQSNAISLAIRESLANGITTNVNSYLQVTPDKYSNELGRIFHVADISRKKVHTRFALVSSSLKEIDRYESTIGITPNRFYDLPPTWLKEVERAVIKDGCFFAMHLSESIDEVEAFTDNSGPLFDLLTKEDRWFFGKGDRASAWYAVTNSLIPRKSLIINPGYIGGDELGALASNMCTIAISPRLNKRFNLQAFPLEAAINRNINLAVVTETPALSQTISLLDELFELRLVNPTIPPIDLLDLITRNPAKMLKQKGRLGVISKGSVADIIGIKMDRRITEPLEEVISGEAKIHFVIVDGEEILIP